jgi:D-arabinose 1-dehydrogenase-like Zn-dependent alcohol dehydrogenase
MAKMRAVQVSKAGGPLEMVERDIPKPGAGEVLIKVQACGVCHSDSLVKEGHWPGISYPRVPGHEVAGVIAEVGAGVNAWSAGQRVGVGWYGGHCTECESCRRGDFVTCQKGLIAGISYDGGYADYMIAPAQALALIPDELNPVEAGPLLCAGITTFNALRNSIARPGDLVAILGIGGLGHLAVQFAKRMGFNTVAIARGKEKEELAKKLGAHHYIDSQASNVADELKKLGGAKVVLATVTNSDAMAATIGGLGIDGTLLVVGASFEPLNLSVLQMIGPRLAVKAWASGTSIDSEDTLKFSVLTEVRSMNEQYELDKANEAYERMMSGKAKFRVVLTTGN